VRLGHGSVKHSNRIAPLAYGPDVALKCKIDANNLYGTFGSGAPQ
jgi:hypothetical protein